MRYLSWIVTVPLALVAISFAVSNREEVALGLWPLPFEVRAPLYLLTLGAVVLGFLIGGFVAWNAQRRHRRAGRASARRVEDLEGDLTEARAAQAEARLRLAAAPAGAIQDPPLGTGGSTSDPRGG